MNNFTIILNTCDKYKEAWLPFLALLDKQWNGCNVPIVINTESEDFEYSNLNISVHHSDKKAWGDRLADTLSSVDTELVLCFLEDFFIQKKIKTEKLYFYVDEMVKNPLIGAFYFNRISGYSKVSQKYSDFYEMKATDDNSEYMFNCQAALWRKSVLIEAAKGCANPWEFEVSGYNKVADNVKQYSFFCNRYTRYDKVRKQDMFSYVLDRNTGYGIYASKWLWNNKKLFKKENIPFEFDKLEEYTRWEYYKSVFASKWDDVRKRLRIS